MHEGNTRFSRPQIKIDEWFYSVHIPLIYEHQFYRYFVRRYISQPTKGCIVRESIEWEEKNLSESVKDSGIRRFLSDFHTCLVQKNITFPPPQNSYNYNMNEKMLWSFVKTIINSKKRYTTSVYALFVWIVELRFYRCYPTDYLHSRALQVLVFFFKFCWLPKIQLFT